MVTDEFVYEIIRIEKTKGRGKAFHVQDFVEYFVQ